MNKSLEQALTITSSDINKICGPLGELAQKSGSNIWLYIGLAIVILCVISSSVGLGIYFWGRSSSEDNKNK